MREQADEDDNEDTEEDIGVAVEDPEEDIEMEVEDPEEGKVMPVLEDSDGDDDSDSSDDEYAADQHDPNQPADRNDLLWDYEDSNDEDEVYGDNAPDDENADQDEPADVYDPAGHQPADEKVMEENVVPSAAPVVLPAHVPANIREEFERFWEENYNRYSSTEPERPRRRTPEGSYCRVIVRINSTRTHFLFTFRQTGPAPTY